MTVREVIDKHPRPTSVDREALLRCIEECFDCAPSCVACADACLGEPDVADLVRCARLCLDCADTCNATGRILTRQTEPDLAVLRAATEACLVACRASGDECERHAPHHEHCRVCLAVCRSCEQACADLIAAMG